MAQLFPARNACIGRMTQGERRFALRAEELLEDDYLVWFDVPVGPRSRHPDFLVFHPSRGFLVLEIKDWKLDTVAEWDRISVTLNTERGRVHSANPLVQARSYAIELNGVLQRDAALLHPRDHPRAGKLLMPFGFGVVLANITRAQFDAHELGDVIPPHKVICRDEMTENAEAESFQQRLWDMFDTAFPCNLTLPQIERFRYHVFPELRISAQPNQIGLFGDPGEAKSDLVPDIVKVMDLQQEQLARSLGEGHRVIHGVAGSGKTMILGYRCLHLARIQSKPILVLCYNKTLAARLGDLVEQRGLAERVQVRNFHGWCYDMLSAYGVSKPSEQGDAFFQALVTAVSVGVEQGVIPRGQYGAVLIDEGHDFEPLWLRLVVQMVDPSSNSLLLLYDDAQSIYAGRRNSFSFSSVGIQARGRTTVLKLNYRNTLEVLTVARLFADDVLNAHDSDDDDVPLIDPQSAGRRGAVPELICCSGRNSETDLIVARIRDALSRGRSPNDIAVLCRTIAMGQRLAQSVELAGIPSSWIQGKQKAVLFSGVPSVKFMTLHSSKGLEFGTVFIPRLCEFPTQEDVVLDEARLLYVGMTRSIDELIVTHLRESPWVDRLRNAVQETVLRIAA